MLGFTLSKLNLLIFVIAVFSIVSYFLLSFQTSATAKIALDLVKIQSSDAYSIITSDSLCDSKEILLPRSLSLDPSSRLGEFYLLNISKLAGESSTRIVFSVSKRKTPETIITASSIDVSGQIFLFGYSPEERPNDPMQLEEEKTVLDPQSLTPINKILLIKEVIGGENKVYFIPCSTENPNGCLPFRVDAMELLESTSSYNRDEENEYGGFRC